ncbi:unnamed protein product [Adineta steineri]|uniref:Uncharacterized protein n=1 Tax=Adineta steineri TaxID=433720 RepID=A0A820CKK8_9BILA|nr:unnamed protein product [Adineta steineri]
MTSHETVPSSLSNTPTTVMSSIHSSQDCFNPVILMTSNSIRSVSSMRSAKKKCSINLSHRIRKSFTRKPRPPIELIMTDMSYRLNLRLYAVQNSLQDYRVGLTKTKICLIILELLICAIHPVPHSSPQLESEEVNLNSSASYSFSYTAIDVGLGLPSEYFFFIPFENNITYK